MKQIVELYGRAIIAIMVMSTLLMCISGVFYGDSQRGSAVGQLANESIDQAGTYQMTGDAFLQYKANTLPEIVYIEDYEVIAGVYVPVESCIQARSGTGEVLPVEVTYIRNIHEENVPVQNIDGKTHFYFDLQGVYQVFVKATDKDNNTTSAMVKIPVNKGELD